MRAYKFPEYDEPVYDCKDRMSSSSAAATPPWTPSAPRCAWARARPSIFYRRTEAEMPARKEEVHHAKDEGINFQLLVDPVELHRRQETGDSKP